ncbi:hypothetical protein [Aquamicrobium sp. LC103]|uniref:hypothetical protein n=1 Tax=Aquamicrobium sp. LC103 TaxID=1120658 RepID=UPI00063EA228|nr:hypothetical protein [Aquamicrobium sp. LC103]TKT79989.1 hypothetical protein XW59_006400 [Aquamicrobium sp. LC103]
MDIGGAISAVTAAIGFARELNNVDVQIDQAELKLKIAELTGSLADAKLGLVEIADELRDKDAEIAHLKSAFEFKASLVEKEGFKFEAFPDGTPRGEPFCPRCEINHGRFYRMSMIVGGARKCPECKTDYLRAPAYMWGGE